MNKLGVAGVVSVTLVGILELVGLVWVSSISVPSINLSVSIDSMMVLPSDLEVSVI